LGREFRTEYVVHSKQTKSPSILPGIPDWEFLLLIASVCEAYLQLGVTHPFIRLVSLERALGVVNSG
jgi:hypothetical protein